MRTKENSIPTRANLFLYLCDFFCCCSNLEEQDLDSVDSISIVLYSFLGKLNTLADLNI